MIEWIKTKDQRPEDGQRIFYYFEPFNKEYVGVYDEESDSVCGNSGFTTMIPEVPYWIPVPAIPGDESENT